MAVTWTESCRGQSMVGNVGCLRISWGRAVRRSYFALRSTPLQRLFGKTFLNFLNATQPLNKGFRSDTPLVYQFIAIFRHFERFLRWNIVYT